MRIFFTLFFVITLFGCTAPEQLSRNLQPPEPLSIEIERILADSIFQHCLTGIKIVSIDRGDILFEKNNQLLLRPASNMKLFTTMGAIGLLDKDFQFSTEIFADSIDRSGVIHGNLYFRGGGNPSLGVSDIDSITARLRSLGLKRITGDIVADHTFFDQVWFGKGWMWDDEPYSYGAPISALSVNENCVRVTVQPGRLESDSVRIIVDPPTGYVSIINKTRTVRDSILTPLRITRLFHLRQNTILIEGDVLLRSGQKSELVSIWQPELFAATLLKERLERQNIWISGSVRVGITPDKHVPITKHTWPLDSVIFKINKLSNNLAAENLLKTISSVYDRSFGSSEHGIYLFNQFFSKIGIDTLKYVMADGSGVSHYNLVSPDIVITLLSAIARDPSSFNRFYESLPIAGIDGTLSQRMIGTSAAINLRAKTGTMSGISTLSGYVRTVEGELLAFSIFMQNFLGSSKPYRDAQDRIGALLSNYKRSQELVSTP